MTNAERSKAWRVIHPDYMRDWRKANRAHVRESNRERNRKWRQTPKGRATINRIARRYWSRHNTELAEKNRQSVKAWAAAHPHEVRLGRRIREQRRRARKLNAFRAEVVPDVIYERDGGICGICHRRVSYLTFSIDHVIPLALGGTHEPDNVQISHLNCNRRKGARLL